MTILILFLSLNTTIYSLAYLSALSVAAASSTLMVSFIGILFLDYFTNVKFDVKKISNISDYLLLPIFILTCLNLNIDKILYLFTIPLIIFTNFVIFEIEYEKSKKSALVKFVFSNIIQLISFIIDFVDFKLCLIASIGFILIYLKTISNTKNSKQNIIYFVGAILFILADKYLLASYHYATILVTSGLLIKIKEDSKTYITCIIIIFLLYFFPIFKYDEHIYSVEAAFIASLAMVISTKSAILYSEQTRYGKISVEADEVNNSIILYNDNIIHGFQIKNNNTATSYYGANSPLEQFLNSNPLKTKIAVIGLGVGTIAAYGRLGYEIDFYEISPEINFIANKYFSFIKNSLATIEIIIGDARKTIKNRQKRYDIIIIDAYIGKNIPSKFFTYEAFETYTNSINESGFVIFNMGSHKIEDKITRLISEFNLDGFYINYLPENKNITSNDNNFGLIKQKKIIENKFILQTKKILGKFFDGLYINQATFTISYDSSWLILTSKDNNYNLDIIDNRWEKTKNNFATEIITDIKINNLF